MMEKRVKRPIPGMTVGNYRLIVVTADLRFQIHLIKLLSVHYKPQQGVLLELESGEKRLISFECWQDLRKRRIIATPDEVISPSLC